MILLLFVLGLFFQNCSNPSDLDSTIFYCDAEETTFFSNQFKCQGNYFEEANGVTSAESYQGDYSCLTDINNPNGMIFKVTNPHPGESFKIAVFRKSKGNFGGITMVSSDGSITKSQQISYGLKDANGWDKLSFNIQLPQNLASTIQFKVYVFNPNKNEKVYFDDLKIIRHALNENHTPPKDTLNRIDIQLKTTDYAALNSFRDKALKQGVISKNLKKEFKGTLNYHNQTYPIEIRLKGDWTDHLTGYKWSYRIKIKGQAAFMGLKSFSIQAPEVRSFLNEWVVHQFCMKEDLLTTQLAYVPVSINGINLGIYNLEEHFEKQLLESKNRREGPILKFSEDGFWERNLHLKNNGIDPQKPIYSAASIRPFKLKKTLKTAKLKAQFLTAQNLMLNYKMGSPNPAHFLDIKRVAKVHALMSIFNIDHAITWHNQRLYYNPVSTKLELIVYDCYAGPGDEYLRPVKINGNDSVGKHKITNRMAYFNKHLFDDPLFLSYYTKYLKKYASDHYINNTLRELSPAIDSLTTLLQEDYPTYIYDKNLLKSNANEIRKQLPDYLTKVKDQSIKYELHLKVDTGCVSQLIFKNFAINAHINRVDKTGEVDLSLVNYHCAPLLIIGYSTKAFPDSIIKVPSPILLAEFSNKSTPSKIRLKEKPKRIFFKTEESAHLYKTKPLKWKRPTLMNSFAKTNAKPLLKNTSLYTLQNDTLTFKQGKHYILKSIVIPKGKTVIFKSGTELVLNNKTYFMSYSPVQMLGIEKSPIKISSMDNSGNGFTIMNAESMSTLNYVNFNGLNTFDKNGWTLTGAVTFFESPVTITNSTFSNNHCEDALNIVNSKFKMNACVFENIFADGFDGDFCKGTVDNSIFEKVGNDCLDFSGSEILISNCKILNAGDKGISCGEQSTLQIKNVTIDGATIGIASKDKSNVIVNKINLKNCKTGFSIFQKKPEYGPAFISVSVLSQQNVENPYFCQEGSSIKLN